MIPKKGLKIASKAVFDLKTGPNLIGQHQQKVGLRVKRKHAQQGRGGGQPGQGLHQAMACHVKFKPVVGGRWR